MSGKINWLEREQTAKGRQRQRYLEQFSPGRVFVFEPGPGCRIGNLTGQQVTVRRAPRLDVKLPSLRVEFPDGEVRTVKPSMLKRIPLETRRAVPAEPLPPRPGRLLHPPIVYQDLPPLPETRTRLERITHEARFEINLLATSIHRRYFVPDVRPVRTDRLARQVSATVSQLAPNDMPDPGPGLASPRRDERATLYRESYHGAYSDALEACRQLAAGNVDTAEWYAEQALAHRANLARATRALEAGSLAHSTGRYFRGELLSVRQYQKCDDPKLRPAFTQWYVRLVFTWSEDGITLLVANGAQLEGETGVEVGPEGWGDLCRWVQAMTDIRDGKRQGRRVSNDRELIYAYREERESFELRRSVHREYPHLLRAMECLRRALHQPLDLELGELPDDRPAPGYHEARPWDDVAQDDTVDDDELAVASR